MILSVMVISHNQACLIRRCLDSVLAQQIDEPWEVIVSDDYSTDETWTIIQEYVSKYPKSKKIKGGYSPVIHAYRIDSSKYSPTTSSDRCAANKANVYKHARGQFCVNIDADDYLLGHNIYQYQINQLKRYPRCSMAVQNIWYQDDGKTIEEGHLWHPRNKWSENEIISLQEYCKRRAFISNPAFMMRRDEMLDPMDKYGLMFDDPIISAHHFQKGEIICSTKAQYVYVQYHNSIWNQVNFNMDDRFIRNLTVLVAYVHFFPKEKYSFLELEHYNWITNLRSILKKKKSLALSEQTNAYVKRLNNNCLEKIIRGNRMYIFLLLCIMLLISKTNNYKGLLAATMCKVIEM